MTNSITFARIGMLHSSIITPADLTNSLQEISKSLVRNNLRLPTFSSNITDYLDIIEPEAYQSNSKLIFALKIPLVEPEIYTAYHLYPIPVLDKRTGLFHILPTTQKHIARDDDSLLYVSPQHLDEYTNIPRNTKLCFDILPYPIDNDAICEDQLLQ